MYKALCEDFVDPLPRGLGEDVRMSAMAGSRSRRGVSGALSLPNHLSFLLDPARPGPRPCSFLKHMANLWVSWKVGQPPPTSVITIARDRPGHESSPLSSKCGAMPSWTPMGLLGHILTPMGRESSPKEKKSDHPPKPGARSGQPSRGRGRPEGFAPNGAVTLCHCLAGDLLQDTAQPPLC